jgi:hypothetical protein
VRTRAIAAVVLLAATAAVVWWFGFRSTDAGGRRVIPGENDGVTVEVLNASGRSALARRVTRELRRHAFDVVSFGTAPFDTLTTTILAVRRGDTLQATRLREVIGTGRITVDPDPGLLLDVSVYLGRDVVPPPIFRP